MPESRASFDQQRRGPNIPLGGYGPARDLQPQRNIRDWQMERYSRQPSPGGSRQYDRLGNLSYDPAYPDAQYAQ